MMKTYNESAEARQERNYALNLEEREARQEVLESMPFVLRLGFSDNCNLKCVFCRSDPNNSDFMPMELVEKLADVFPYVRKTWLFGWGEPLLHPSFQRIADYVSGLGTEVCFLTNGQLITDDIARRWVEGGIGHVRISIDAARAETYEKLRRGGKFDRLMRGIESINRWKSELGAAKPSLGFNFVAMRENIEELPELVRMASRLGAGDVGVAYLKNYMFPELTAGSLFFHQELSDAMMLEAERTAKKLGVRLVLPDLFSRAASARGGDAKICTEPWSTAFIRHDGAVGACCAGMIDMGNLFETPFEEIWNGKPYRELRRLVNSPNPPEACRICVDNQQKSLVTDPAFHLAMPFYEKHISGENGMTAQTNNCAE